MIYFELYHVNYINYFDVIFIYEKNNYYFIYKFNTIFIYGLKIDL